MDLKQLQTLGAFVPTKLIRREIEISRPILKPESEWAIPGIHEFTDEVVRESMTVFLRKRASADFMEMIATEDREKASVSILRCVCNEDGTQVFESVEQVSRLEDWIFLPLIAVVMEVNKYGPKQSPSRKSSGANSRSASAVARSRNGKRSLPKKSGRSGSRTTPSAGR
jgi:hypothetical protein